MCMFESVFFFFERKQGKRHKEKIIQGKIHKKKDMNNIKKDICTSLTRSLGKRWDGKKHKHKKKGVVKTIRPLYKSH